MHIDNPADGYVKKTAVFRALQLGDMLCAIPAVRAFKKFFPESEITLIGLPWAEDFLKRFPRYFSSFTAFPGHPELIEQPFNAESYNDFISKASERKYDLIIQMHGNGSVTNTIVNELRGKMTAGFFERRENAPNERLFMPYPDDVHEVSRHLQLMRFLGVPSQGDYLEFPVLEDENAQYRELCKEFDLKEKEYVCIHPGARDEMRRWSPHNFACIADMIAGKGCKVILTGSVLETEVVSRVENAMRHSAVNLAGKTGLGVLAAMIRNCRLLVCNDTGVSHIAAAVGTPSIVVFSASDPQRWAPLNRALHRVILPDQALNPDHALIISERMLLDDSYHKNSLKVA